MPQRYRNDLTPEYIRARFDYDLVGLLRWRDHPDVPPNMRDRMVGQIVGTVYRDGRRRTTIAGVPYLLSRLIWVYHNGQWPDGMVDHHDLNTQNDRIGNLRDATYSQNNKNTPRYKNNKSGHKGVSWDKREGQWRVVISVDKKYLHVGYYHDFDEACTAYDRKNAELHGEFGRVE